MEQQLTSCSLCRYKLACKCAYIIGLTWNLLWVPCVVQVQNVERPPPLVAVTQNDQRHPQNVQQMIKGQSNQEEHKSALVDALRKQQSDKSEAAGKAGSSGAGEKGSCSKVTILPALAFLRSGAVCDCYSGRWFLRPRRPGGTWPGPT